MISNRTQILISAENLRHNVAELSKVLASNVKKMAVIKSNAYGHDLLYCAWTLAPVIDWFAVDDIEEAKILRQHGIRLPILVLGYVPEEWYQLARSLKLTLTSPSMLTLRWAVNHGVDTHIKIDSGLGRQGFYGGEEYEQLLKYLERNTSKHIKGIYTHFAVSDNPEKIEYTQNQISNYVDIRNEVEEKLGHTIMSHTSSTSAGQYIPETQHDMVRLGIGIYGLWPSRKLQEFVPELDLKPVLTWNARISEIKSLPRGQSIGYDQTHILERDSIIGIVPVGYWHGLPRLLSNKGVMAIRGVRIPIIGNISMDMCAVDLTDIEHVRQGDIVEIIGETVSVIEQSEFGGMNHYELVTRLNPYIERKLIQ